MNKIQYISDDFIIESKIEWDFQKKSNDWLCGFGMRIVLICDIKILKI